MEERDFVEKYGFSLEDLEVACIDDLMSKGFICYDVKELAYKIASDIYEELKVDNIDYYTMYKWVKTKYGYVHKNSNSQKSENYFINFCNKKAISPNIISLYKYGDFGE